MSVLGFVLTQTGRDCVISLVREARQCSGRQWRRLSSAEFGTLSARDLVQTENKQSEVSVRDARRVKDCESGAW